MSEDRTDWLLWRREGIGATDVAGIVGLSPYASRWSVWAEKVGLLPLDSDENERLRFGREMEPYIVRRFEEATGMFVIEAQARREHPEHPWRRCTLDGLVVEGPVNSTPLGAIELKTDFGSSTWEDGLPLHIEAQAQWQMHVAGVERVWIAALHGWRFRYYELERNDRTIAWLVREAERFWNEHVVTGDPPEVDGSDATQRALNAAYPRHEPEVSVTVDDQLWAEYLAAQADEKDAKARVQELGNRVRAAMGDAEVATLPDGAEAFTWRKSKPTRKVDTDRAVAVLMEVAPERIDDVWVEVEGSRRLLVKRPKKQKEND